MATTGGKERCLTTDNMNEHLKVIDYAQYVKSPLVNRAEEIEKELEEGASKPFKSVLKANIGDCQSMGQKPITFIRQVVALVACPSLLNSDDFPDDVKRRARDLLSGCRGGSMGSYPDAPGLEIVRRHIAQYIERRDGGIPSDWHNIIVSMGASQAINTIFKIINQPMNEKLPGVMVPIPKHPLYSATLAEFNMAQIGYYLNEDKAWGIDEIELQRVVDEAKKTCNPRAIVVINPGNPTGQVLSRENIEGIIKFAHKQNLFLFADEVYQDNVYAKGRKFHSFKKVISEMGPPYSEMELASFMSCSKGYMGECGLRGGYTEVINLCPQVMDMLLNAITAMLCATVLGQAALDCTVNPPKLGEPSYELFNKEKEAVLAELAKGARMATDSFNSIPGIKCNEVQGAMYAFPSISIPSKAIAEAEFQGLAPDEFYAFQLLEETGICVVPGSAFGQREGTFHFRMAILPKSDDLKCFLDAFKQFHGHFVMKYS